MRYLFRPAGGKIGIGKLQASDAIYFFVVLKAQNNNPPRRIPPHMNNIIQADAGIIFKPFLLIYT
jgi:hypothetical protein